MLQWIKKKATVKERKALKAKVKAIEEEIESLDTELSQLKFQGPINLKSLNWMSYWPYFSVECM